MEEALESLNIIQAPKTQIAKIIRQNTLKISTGNIGNDKKFIQRLLQSDNVPPQIWKETVWKVFDESKRLKELIALLLETHGENPKQVYTQTVDSLELLVSESTHKIKNKFHNYDIKLHKLESQLKTMGLDSKTREKIWMQEMESLNFGIDKYKEDFEALSQNMKEMENKFMVMLRDKNSTIERLCTQLQKCSGELKNSTRELMDKNKTRIHENILNTKKILDEIKENHSNLKDTHFNDIEYNNYLRTIEINQPNQLLPSTEPYY